jgi:hypothetical protein
LAQEQLPQDLPEETDLENEPEETYAEEESYWEPRHIRVPRRLVWGIIILLALVTAALALWGVAQSTLTYGGHPVDAATTERLTKLHTTLRAAGAPETALRRLAVAAQPGVNVGDAFEALVDADKALEPVGGAPAIASARQDLRSILATLCKQQYWFASCSGGGGRGFNASAHPGLALKFVSAKT